MRIGILGGGQLAQMLTQSAISLGLETAIFEQTADTPASRLTHSQVVARWTDTSAITTFGQLCDLITLENEFVDAGVLRQFEAMGLPVYPTSHTLERIQDKLTQKVTMIAQNIPLPIFAPLDTLDTARHFGEKHGYPFLLKARRNSYDGYGNATIHTPEDIQPHWERLSQGDRALMAEAFVPFTHELAVMVVRGRDGQTVAYPVVETIQKNHVCHVVRAPANLSAEIIANARYLAIEAVKAIDGVGIFGVELFLLADGSVLFNEIAPRPHNSGHYTIEGCVTSQFENHLRAVMGLPLGSVALCAPAVVMVNLLGTKDGMMNGDDLANALQYDRVHVHLYGKRQLRKGRKMGHLTVLAESLAEAESIGLQAAAQFDI
ncbi:MAG: 5-(carboxyamino)imidazole ribonucleotide synthase [bacterium]|nr:5-(carboxyamino)imidazole ribonucleotide synthase [bacterium]